MQSYICVKSLVRLDVYKKAGIVLRPKQREGWELKKWETWKCMLGKDADMRSQIHKFEHDLLNKQYNIAEHVLTELNQVLQRKPDNPDQPLSSRRLNWVEQNREQQRLMARLSKIKHMIKVQCDSVLAFVDVLTLFTIVGDICHI
ncbi:hypothetical protein ACQJBY_044415 [Aegilops geniculata]